MKYIIVGNKNFVYPIIFPDNLPHVCISESVCNNPEFKGLKLKPISAGFIELNGIDGVKCWGESESLNLKSKKKDSDIINLYHITHGIRGMI